MLIFAGEFDITINLMSLFGMIVVIGILVDDGIVIAENIFRHYEQGKHLKMLQLMEQWKLCQQLFLQLSQQL